MKKYLVLTIMFSLLLSSFAFAESFNGRVISVLDGNNIIVMNKSEKANVRLEGVDCPEFDQILGSQAKQFVIERILGQEVWVDVRGKDHDNRLVSIVKKGDKNIALELANAGLAWYDAKFQEMPEVASAIETVKSEKIGIWALANPTPPSKFRRICWDVTPIMSKQAHSSGQFGDFGWQINKKGDYGYITATNPPKGNKGRLGGGGPGTSSNPSCTGGLRSCPPSSSGPNTAAPGGNFR